MPTPTPSPPATPAYSLLWRQSLGTAGPPTLAITDTLVLVGGGTAPLAARATDDGHDVWASPLVPSAPPAIGDHLVLVASEQQLTALDEATGAMRWHDDLPAPAGSLIWRAGWLFVSMRQSIRAYRAADGAQLWEHALPSAIANGPVLDGDRLFAALDDSTVLSIDIKTPADVWRTTALEYRPGPMLAADGLVYFGGSDGNVHAIEEKNGTLAWDFRARAIVVGAPVADAMHVYVALIDNTVRALDASIGSQRWTQTLTARPFPGLLLADDQVVVPLSSGDLLACPARLGPPAKTAPFPKPPDAPPGFFHRVEAVAGSPDGKRVFLVTASLQEERTLTALERAK